MDEKLISIVLVCLLIGAGAGFLIEYNVLYGKYTQLKNDYEQLEDDYSTLQNQHSQLETGYQELEANYNTLNTTYNQLRESYGALNITYYNLNESYIELSQEYADLLFHYNLLNKPASNFTTIKDLNITLALHRTIYYYKDPVSGNVTITYLNGTAFRGSFILYIRHLTKEVMSTTAWISIDGFTELYLSPPVFQFGPGNYTIGISSLSTADGYIIESRWQVFPSVQVEAK